MLQIPAPPVEVHWWKVLLPANAGEFWQLVAAIAGIAVVIVAAKGLRSLALTQEDLKFTKQNLKLVQQDIETRSQREAIAVAIQQAQAMRKELFPEYEAVLAVLAAARIPIFVTRDGDVSFSEQEEQAKIDAARGWLGALTPDLQKKMLSLCNALETWAMPFAHGLADETKRAFQNLGASRP